jgi:hypothetical protein
MDIRTAGDGAGLEWSGRLPWSLLVGIGVACVGKLLPNRFLSDHRCGFMSLFIEKVKSFAVSSSKFLDTSSLRTNEEEEKKERGGEGGEGADLYDSTDRILRLTPFLLDKRIGGDENKICNSSHRDCPCDIIFKMKECGSMTS